MIWNRDQHHPRRRRATLGARQKMRHLTRKETLDAVEEHQVPFGARQIGDVHCMGPLCPGIWGRQR